MINLTSQRARARFHRSMVAIMIRLEKWGFRRYRKIIDKQVRSAAREVLRGNPQNVEWSVDKFSNEQISLLKRLYKKSATIFGNMFFEEYDKQKGIHDYRVKEPLDDYWNVMNLWIQNHATEQVRTVVNPTMKKWLQRMLAKGVEEGKSNSEISKDILDKGLVRNRYIAERITRTETHTAAMKATSTAAGTVPGRTLKEWSAAGDARTRTEHLDADAKYRGEGAIPLQENFIVGGESLEYPGDSSGSAWNVINCRCIELYQTEKPVATI